MNMQSKILNTIEDSANQYDLDFVISSGAVNTGTVYIMDGLDVVLTVTYNFQTAYCSINSYKSGVKPGGDRGKISSGSCGYLEYYDTPKLKGVLNYIDNYLMEYDMEKEEVGDED